MADEKFTIEIVVGNGFKINTLRTELANVNETSDGVVFQFKGGSFYTYFDHNMPSYSKNLIKNSLDRIVKGNVKVDLRNYKRPVEIEF